MNLWHSLVQSSVLAVCPQRQKKRMARRFLRRYGNLPFLFRGAYGLLYFLQTRNVMDSETVQHGIYEKPEIEQLLNYMHENKPDLFLDIGANLGTYSLAVASETDCPRLIAFEPDPLNRAKLYANIFLNDFAERIEVREEALSNCAQMATFYAAREDSAVNENTGASSLEAHHHNGNARVMKVRTVRLDDALEPIIGQSIAIKLDIEGHEAAALEGMEKLIANNYVWMQIEMLPAYAERTQAILKKLDLIQMQAGSAGHNYIYASPPH